jgi:hypothetical protein
MLDPALDPGLGDGTLRRHGLSSETSTTTVFYKMAHLTDNGGNTKPLEGR